MIKPWLLPIFQSEYVEASPAAEDNLLLKKARTLEIFKFLGISAIESDGYRLAWEFIYPLQREANQSLFR
jgi:hypothetical protein